MQRLRISTRRATAAVRTSRHAERLKWLANLTACAACSAATLPACDEEQTTRRSASSAAVASSSAALPGSSARKTTAGAPPAAARVNEPEDAPDAGSILDTQGLIDVAPAGPATAHQLGVVMVDRKNALRIATLKRSSANQYDLQALGAERDEFAPYGRGPAIQDDHAYWIDDRKLLRRALGGGELETLRSDARAGTRVSTAPGPVAAYIAKHGKTLVARLWSRKDTITLSPEGSSAHSVSLVGVDQQWIATYQEVRTAMSPLHARRLALHSDKPQVGSDTVVWVGASGQPLTEITAVATEEAYWALVAMEKSIVKFGLAQVRVGPNPSTDGAVNWRLYPNGSDPSPVAAARACGQAMVAYSRPATAAPRSPQELHLAHLEQEGLSGSVLVARSRAFSNLSLAGLKGAMLVVYVADNRTWARVVACDELLTKQ